MKKQLKEFKKNNLTIQQSNYYPVVKWLFGRGPRRSGRTFLIALFLIEKSIEDRGWVKIFNHDFPQGQSITRMESNEVLLRIHRIIEQIPEFKIEVREAIQHRTVAEIKVTPVKVAFSDLKADFGRQWKDPDKKY